MTNKKKNKHHLTAKQIIAKHRGKSCTFLDPCTNGVQVGTIVGAETYKDGRVLYKISNIYGRSNSVTVFIRQKDVKVV